jgi:hypothetical protein
MNHILLNFVNKHNLIEKYFNSAKYRLYTSKLRNYYDNDYDNYNDKNIDAINAIKKYKYIVIELDICKKGIKYINNNNIKDLISKNQNYADEVENTININNNILFLKENYIVDDFIELKFEYTPNSVTLISNFLETIKTQCNDNQSKPWSIGIKEFIDFFDKLIELKYCNINIYASNN